jgi:thiol-disulfide isomerase/thioredoxin
MLSILALLLAAAPLGDVKDFALTDVAGKKHTAQAWPKQKAIVLLFVSTDCPVSNFYAPEYARLAKLHADKNVLFYAIHSDPFTTAEEAAKHAVNFKLTFPVLLDPAHVVTKQTGVRVVPEVVVLTPAGRIVYRGRVDDRYSADGVRREVPTTHELADALAALLEGNMPAVAETKAYGCPLPEPRKP